MNVIHMTIFKKKEKIPLIWMFKNMADARDGKARNTEEQAQ